MQHGQRTVRRQPENRTQVVGAAEIGGAVEIAVHVRDQAGRRVGSIVTAGGLVFIGATTDSRFRAFDSRSGKQLWVAELAASAHATPITYMGKKSGKQFVVIAAGGGGFFQGNTSDEVVAFSLPD